MGRRPSQLLLALVLLAPALAARTGAAQCMLANPSFEVAGTGGNFFGGWNQFGAVGTSTTAIHGHAAARVSGPNTGVWDVSGYWQPEGSVAGDVWDVTGYVRVPASAPLAGGSKAIVNVEWRNASGALISFESHDVATAASPRDTAMKFAFATGAAPAGTASARLLLGVLQGPTDPQRDAIYDQITFVKRTNPSLAAMQWSDFPGGRTISFAGRTWRVKGPGFLGPGPNTFTDAAGAVFTDAGGSLHLTIAKNGTSTMQSTEVACVDPLGYGDYVFTIRGRPDQFQTTTVFGLFLWEYGPCYDPSYLWWNPYNEIDVEFGRWGVPGGPVEQFVAQPFDWGGNRHQFAVGFTTNEITTHAFRWLPDRVEFRAWRGGPSAESPLTTIDAWTYTGPHIPRPDQPRVHLNMWYNGAAPTATQEGIVDGFVFTPYVAPTLDAPAPQVLHGGASLALASRNPARGLTTLRLTLARDGVARVALHDLAGRKVRTLLDAQAAAGARELVWDGRDDAGALVAPGVYLATLDAEGARASVRVVVLR